MSNGTSRRDLFLGALGATLGWFNRGCASMPPAVVPSTPHMMGAAPLRPLGRTGFEVSPVSLGGEGILRTHGQFDDAVPMILEALACGVRYCDTAPAYAQSQDYYGEAFRQAGSGARERLWVASKTHERDRDGSLRLLDQSLRRIGTDHLDVWQLHDLRDADDLREIFGPRGSLEAAVLAKADGRVRHIGITGHHDPTILVEALRRHPFDTVLCPINPADPQRLPFVSTVVAEARARGVGVIAMKVVGRGRLITEGVATAEELIRYAASIADTAIIGCSSPAEVRENFLAGARFIPMTHEEQRGLEARVLLARGGYDDYKRP